MWPESEKDTVGDTVSIIFEKSVAMWVMSSQGPALHANLVLCKYGRLR